MFSLKNNRYYKKVTIALLLLFVVSVAFADKHGNQTAQNNRSLSVSNSSVTLDFSLATGESWDAIGSSNNVLLNCFNGESVTAFEYTNITIQTEGGSFFNEAIMYFSSSANEDDGLNAIKLKVATANESSGTASFSSDGLLDLTDSGQPDIFSLADSKFNLQFYEEIDDSPNAIDARFIDGKLKIYGVDLVVNTNCPFVLNNLPQADLSVTHDSEIVEANHVGNSIQITIDVTNNSSENSATNVRLSSTLSDNLVFTQASCDDNNNSADVNEIEILSVNDIPANGTLQCLLTAEIVEIGEYTNTLTVLSDNDHNPSNNSLNIVVRGPAIVVPTNNLIALLILALALFYSTRRLIKA